MAITQRTRIIANPARRRMSAKQRAIFGRTPAIRAAARRRIKTRRRAPHGKRKNPAEVIGFTLANPARRNGGNMPKANPKRNRKNPRRVNRRHERRHSAHHVRHHRRRLNPPMRMMKMNRRRRRNPSGMGSLTGIVTNAVFVLVGALGSKLGAQLILGSNNTSWVGYAGNAAVGVGLWFLTEHVMKNKEASSGVIAGTVVEIILRIINDMTPFGQYTSSLGMGDYQMQSFVTPQVLVDPYNSAQIAIPPGWAPTTVVAPPAAAASGGMVPSSGMGSNYGNAYDNFSVYGY
jgi:hypothetical protein